MNSWRIGSRLRVAIMLSVGVFLCLPLVSHAVLYAPGETLDPSCAPTDVDCGITPGIASSTANSIPYYAANGSVLSATSSLTILGNGNIGIGTLTPSAKLTIDNTSVATGPELVTNGTFTGSAAGWTLGSNVAYGTNNVVSTYVGGDPSVSTTFETVAGETYLLTLTISDANHPMNYYLQHNSLSYEASPTSNGTKTYVFESNYTGTETIVFDDWFYQNGDTWTIDNVSIKKISAPTPGLKVIGFDGTTWLSLGEDILGNTGFGVSSLQSNTTGNFNTAYGINALSTNTTGNGNTAVGSLSLQFNTSGRANVAIGEWALLSNTTGDHNTAVGELSLYKTTTGFRNTALGAYTLLNNTTGTYNIALGYQAGMNQTTGSENILIGRSTISASYGQVTTGSNNISIGNNVAVVSPTASNQLNIGNLIYGTGLDGTGTTLSSGKIGIGSTTPNAKLSINSSGSDISPLIIRTNGSTENYTSTNSGMFMYDAAGVEMLRIVASDPDPSYSGYNTWNLYIGREAGASNPSDNSSAGYGNTGVGYRTLTSNTTGYENSAFGIRSLELNTTGSNNTAFGSHTLRSNVDGNDNVAFGLTALRANVSGDANVAIGNYSLYYHTTGNKNTVLGNATGYNPSIVSSQYHITDDTEMVLLGYGATKNNSSTLTNGIAIGSGAHVLESNQVVLGNDSITTTLLKGNIGIGTTSPSSLLSISNSINTAANTRLFTIASTTSGTATSTLMTVLSNGNVGIGKATPTAVLDVSTTLTANWATGQNFLNVFSPTSNNLNVYGTTFTTYDSNTSANINWLHGLQVGAEHAGTGNVSHQLGLEVYSYNNSQAGDIGELNALTLYAENQHGGDVTDMTGIQIRAHGNYGTGTVSNLYGIKIASNANDGGGVVTNNYGIYVEDQSAVGSTNSYNLYSAGTNSKNYFAGSVGIGTTTPSYLLHVGNTAVSGVVSRFENSTGYCDINPTTTSLTCTSDRRLKKNILTLETSTTLDRLQELEAVTYNWLSEDDADSPHAGFIAQDVRLVFPDLVSEDPNGMLSVAYGGFIPYIIESVKELALTIEGWRESFTSDKITTDTLCVLKSDGTELCVTGDDLEAAINGAPVDEEPEDTNPPTDIPDETAEVPTESENTDTDPVVTEEPTDTSPSVEPVETEEEPTVEEIPEVPETPQEDVPSSNEPAETPDPEVVADVT